MEPQKPEESFDAGSDITRGEDHRDQVHVQWEEKYWKSLLFGVARSPWAKFLKLGVELKMGTSSKCGGNNKKKFKLVGYRRNEVCTSGTEEHPDPLWCWPWDFTPFPWGTKWKRLKSWNFSQEIWQPYPCIVHLGAKTERVSKAFSKPLIGLGKSTQK